MIEKSADISSICLDYVLDCSSDSKRLRVQQFVGILKKEGFSKLPLIPVFELEQDLRIKTGKEYVLAEDGRTRYAAAKLAGLKQVPIAILEDKDNEDEVYNKTGYLPPTILNNLNPMEWHKNWCNEKVGSILEFLAKKG